MEGTIKVYVHYECDDNSRCFTKIFRLSKSNEDTAETILNEFVKSYNVKQKGTSLLDGSRFSLHGSDGTTFAQSCKIIYSIQNNEDLFLKSSNTDTSTISDRGRAGKTNTETKSAGDQSNSIVSPSLSKKPAVTNETLDMKTLQKIEKLIEKKSYRSARETCEDLLASAKYDNAYFLYDFLARLKLENKKYDDAESLARKSISSNDRRYESYYILSKALFFKESYEEAIKSADVALIIINKSKKIKSNEKFNILVIKAECFFELGYHNEAVAIINTYMSENGAEEHLPTLEAYAKFALRYNKLEEGLRALLKAVVIDQKNHKIKSLLSKALESSQGIQELYSQIAPSQSSASVYAYLATVCKDTSCLSSAATLYKKSLELLPRSVSYILNLVHIRETVHDSDAGLSELRAFLVSNGSYSDDVAKYCRELLNLMPVSTAALDAQSPLGLRWMQINDQPCVVTTDTEGNIISFYDPLQNQKKLKYTDDFLDVLALGFTVVKILYLRGELHLLPPLFGMMEEHRLKSVVSLHETTIRNEAAYYVCAAQVLSLRIMNSSKGTITE